MFFPFVPPYYSTPITEKYTIDAKVLETQVLEKAGDIPDECYVATTFTTVLATTGLKPIRVATILDNPQAFNNIYNETGCVLFYEDLGCYIDRASTDEGCVFFFDSLHDYDFCLMETPLRLCRDIKARYKTTIYSYHTLGNFTYTFYRLEPKT
jgi:hypothetical protein